MATLAELPESDAAGELARIYDEIRVCCAVPYVSSLRAITALGDGCMGHSCGGLTTKIHALVHADGLPVRLEPTAGQVHDSQPALDMIDCLGKGISCWRTRHMTATRSVSAQTSERRGPIFPQRRTATARSPSANSYNIEGLQQGTINVRKTSWPWLKLLQCEFGSGIMSLRLVKRSIHPNRSTRP